MPTTLVGLWGTVRVGLVGVPIGDLTHRDLPGGIDQYLQMRRSDLAANSAKSTAKSSTSSIADIRTLKKEIAKYERQLEKVDTEISALKKLQDESALDYAKLATVMQDLGSAQSKKNEIEEAWLIATTTLESMSE